jgi:Leucine-rich repeat (LRR) protein
LQLIIDTSASDHPAYDPVSTTSPLKDLPSSLGKLPQLQQLIIRGCNALISLPDSLGDLASLTKLQLVGCHSFKELPASLLQLQALQSMEIDGANSLEVRSWRIE